MDVLRSLPVLGLNSPEAVRQQTDALLLREAAMCERIAAMLWAYKELGDLIPQTVRKVCSGHYFPFSESEFEVSIAFMLAQRGFYRYAFVGLRNVLELGLLSVYWDRSDKAEEEIVAWIRSVEPTPFKSEVLKGLRSIAAVQEFDRAFDIARLIDTAYGSLSDFAHIRGYHYSSRALSRANIVQFNEGSLRRWAQALEQVVPLLVTVHLLKYPVGLRYTPGDQKFGLNGPAGGFLNPWQADRLRAVLNQDHLALLQRISNADEGATSLAAWVDAMPDISVEEFEEQILEFNKHLIRGQGFENWYANELQTYGQIRESDPASFTQFEERAAELREWAEENNLLTGPDGVGHVS